MHRRLPWFLALVLAVPLIMGAGGNVRVVDVEVTEYGLFESDIGEALTPDGPGNQQQVLEMTNERLVEQTNLVPLRTGVILGVHYIVKTDPPSQEIPVVLKLYYPDGQYIWGDTTIKTDQVWFNSYTINDPNAHPEGTYQYVIEYQNQEIVRIPFEFSFTMNEPPPSTGTLTPKPKDTPKNSK